jgi:hypothetical protein
VLCDLLLLLVHAPQVIDDRDIATYNMAGNPEYATIVTAMHEAAKKQQMVRVPICMTVGIYYFLHNAPHFDSQSSHTIVLPHYTAVVNIVRSIFIV